MTDPRLLSPVPRVSLSQSAKKVSNTHNGIEHMADDAYEVPEHHKHILCGFLGMPEDSELPEAIVDTYQKCRRPADRRSQELTDYHLWTIVVLSGEPVPEAPKPTITELWKAKQVRTGDAVLCTLGRQRDLKGAIINVDDGEVLVQMENGDERRFKETKVALAPKT